MSVCRVKAAFTLIELLVVIAILAAMLLSALGRPKQKDRQACKALLEEDCRPISLTLTRPPP